MEPNFQESDYLVVDEISFRLRNPERGEVVVLRSPQVKGQFFLKRIVGLPGETVEIKDDQVVIYSIEQPEGEVLEEDYLDTKEITEGNLKLSLGDDQYFVLGDNRRFSYDSRRWGLLGRKDIVGRVWLRLWPLPQLSVFAAPLYQPAN